MKTSEQIDKIIPALIKFQSEVEPITKDSKNPHFNSRYADYATCIATIRPSLAKNDLCLLHPLANSADDKVMVETIVYHASGQWVACDIAVKPEKGTAQSVGSLISYLKRYSTLSLLGLGTEDDDGNAASHKDTKTQTTSNFRPSETKVSPNTSYTPSENKNFSISNPEHYSLLITRLKTRGIEDVKRIEEIASQLDGKSLSLLDNFKGGGK